MYKRQGLQGLEAVKHHVINPVESREASLAKPETLEENLSEDVYKRQVDARLGKGLR